jgi:GTP-binding protein Era
MPREKKIKRIIEKEEIKPKEDFKCAIVTIIGRSNVGKSTLLNTIIGTKLAAVTQKPQTTRNVIHGVLNRDDAQIVLVDTPGIFKQRHDPLAGDLIKRVQEALQDIDMAIYVVDPTKPIGSEERYTLSLLRPLIIPKILVINKSDLSDKQKEFIDDYRALGEDFTTTFELSALENQHIQPLITKLFELAPPGEPLYPVGQLTNIERDTWVSEIIREKIFLALREEVPYTTHVEVESIEEKEDIFVIKATVFTYDKRYKGMIVGVGGRAIKEIGIAARKELEAALNKKVFLELEVETDKHWMERM